MPSKATGRTSGMHPVTRNKGSRSHSRSEHRPGVLREPIVSQFLPFGNLLGRDDFLNLLSGCFCSFFRGRSQIDPHISPRRAPLHTMPRRVHHAQQYLRWSASLNGGLLKPYSGLCIVLRDSIALVIQAAQTVLGAGAPALLNQTAASAESLGVPSPL
jgi:hypothetical protein